MKRLVFALLVCGMGAVSFGQLLPEFTKLVVLKGTATDSIHYVYNDPNRSASEAQRTALGVNALALSTKPKVYYYLVVELTFKPQFATTGKWTGEGNLELWTMGAVQYGIGRHDVNGVWQSKLAYAYDIGGPFYVGGDSANWWYPKAKARTGDCDVFSSDLAETFADDRVGGVADLVYSAKLVTNKTTGKSWYEPSITSLTINGTQIMQQLIGTAAPAWTSVQFGVGKIVFKQDTALTTKANLTNSTTGANIGLAQAAADIQAALLKGKYTTAATSFVPELDPYLYYP